MSEQSIRWELLTTRQAAKFLNISERLLWQLCKDGKIPTVRLGRRLVRFQLADLLDWIKSRKQTAKQVTE
jgi:excisionase family DNA binding protein